MATYDQCVLELSAAAECVALDAGATCAECFDPTTFQEMFPQDVRTNLYSALAFVSELDPQFCSVANDRVCEAYTTSQSCCCPTETEGYRKCLFNDIMVNQFQIASCTDSCGESTSPTAGKGGGIGLVVIIAVGVVAILLGCVGLFFYRRWKSSGKRSISIQKGESPPGSKATNIDNISAFSEVDFGGDMEVRPKKGSNIICEADLEGAPVLSSSDEKAREKIYSSSKAANVKSEKLRKSSSTVDLEEKAESKGNRTMRKSKSALELTHRDQSSSSSPKTSRDRSNSAKDRKAKAETALQAQLHRSLSALDFAGSDSGDRKDGKGEGKESRRRRKPDTLRKSHSVPDLSREESDSGSQGSPGSTTERKRRAKKLAEKKLSDAVDSAKVSLSRSSSDRSLRGDDGTNDEESNERRRRRRKPDSLNKSQSDSCLRKELSQNDLKSSERNGPDSASNTEKRRAKKDVEKKVSRSSSDRSLKLESDETNDKKSRRRKEGSLRKSQSDPYLSKESGAEETESKRRTKKQSEKEPKDMADGDKISKSYRDVGRSSSSRSLKNDGLNTSDRDLLASPTKKRNKSKSSDRS